jgi:hypothetical protein
MSPSDTSLLAGEFGLRAENLELDARLATESPRIGAPCRSCFDIGRSALAVASQSFPGDLR